MKIHAADLVKVQEAYTKKQKEVKELHERVTILHDDLAVIHEEFETFTVKFDKLAISRMQLVDEIKVLRQSLAEKNAEFQEIKP